MQCIPIESDNSYSFEDDQPSAEYQTSTNLLSDPDKEASFSMDSSNLQDPSKRIGPKLPLNSSNLRTNLKDSPICSAPDSGVSKAKSGYVKDTCADNDDVLITDWNTESAPVEQLQTYLNSQRPSYKPPAATQKTISNNR